MSSNGHVHSTPTTLPPRFTRWQKRAKADAFVLPVHVDRFSSHPTSIYDTKQGDVTPPRSTNMCEYVTLCYSMLTDTKLTLECHMFCGGDTEDTASANATDIYMLDRLSLKNLLLVIVVAWHRMVSLARIYCAYTCNCLNCLCVEWLLRYVTCLHQVHRDCFGV